MESQVAKSREALAKRIRKSIKFTQVGGQTETQVENVRWSWLASPRWPGLNTKRNQKQITADILSVSPSSDLFCSDEGMTFKTSAIIGDFRVAGWELLCSFTTQSLAIWLNCSSFFLSIFFQVRDAVRFYDLISYSTFSLPKANFTKPRKLLNPELSNET